MELLGREDEIIKISRDVLKHEAESISNLKDNIGEEFLQALEIILSSKGRVIFSGIGKSGYIAQKAASTLTSIGIPSGYLHPAEGFHGDLGIVTKGDVMVAVSNSGETREIIELLPPLKRIGVPVIAITGNKNSTLARRADVHLFIGYVRESDPDNLIPTASALTTLAMLDAMTVALMRLRNFNKEDYAFIHPSGMLGRRLTLKVVDLLSGDATNPRIPMTASFREALAAITRYMLGGVSIVDEEEKLCGIITDGDVRRLMERWQGTVEELMNTAVSEIMTKTPTVIFENELASKALELMENHKPRPIFLLPVVNAEGKPIGMIHLHDLVQAGFKTSLDEIDH